MTQKTMKRYVLTHRKGVDGIKLETDAPVPEITSPTQILIKIKALSLNARDIQIATDTYPVPHPIPENLVPLSDGSGEVVAVGQGVKRFKQGDNVSPIIFGGNYHVEDVPGESLMQSLGGAVHGIASEYFVCDEQDAVLVPKHLDHDQASTLTIAYSTAWSSLYSHYPKLLPGNTVLCLGTGGVSLAAAQLALIGGANIILTSSSQSKLDRAKKLLQPLVKNGSVDEVIKTIDYSKIEKWDEEARRMTGGKGVDFVVEIAGQGTIARSVRSTKQGGLVAISGYLSNYDQLPQEIIEEDLAKTILYSAAYVRGVFVCNRSDQEEMNQAITASGLQPVVDKVFDFDQLQEAYQYMVDGKHFGKVVVRV